MGDVEVELRLRCVGEARRRPRPGPHAGQWPVLEHAGGCGDEGPPQVRPAQVSGPREDAGPDDDRGCKDCGCRQAERDDHRPPAEPRPHATMDRRAPARGRDPDDGCQKAGCCQAEPGTPAGREDDVHEHQCAEKQGDGRSAASTLEQAWCRGCEHEHLECREGVRTAQPEPLVREAQGRDPEPAELVPEGHPGRERRNEERDPSACADDGHEHGETQRHALDRPDADQEQVQRGQQDRIAEVVDRQPDVPGEQRAHGECTKRGGEPTGQLARRLQRGPPQGDQEPDQRPTDGGEDAGRPDVAVVGACPGARPEDNQREAGRDPHEHEERAGPQAIGGRGLRHRGQQCGAVPAPRGPAASSRPTRAVPRSQRGSRPWR